MASKAVAKKDEKTAVATYDYGDGPTGFEGTRSEDYTVPFLKILQDLSPECEGSEEFKPGMIFNTGDSTVHKAITFVPVYPDHLWLEWNPREQGGGLVNRWQPDDPLIEELRKTQQFGEYSHDGHDMVETYYMWGLWDNEGVSTPGVLSFKGTQIKKYKSWLTRARSLRVPLWAVRWNITTTREQNAKGRFYGWVIEMHGGSKEAALINPATEEFATGRALHDTILEGTARVVGEEADVPFE